MSFSYQHKWMFFFPFPFPCYECGKGKWISISILRIQEEIQSYFRKCFRMVVSRYSFFPHKTASDSLKSNWKDDLISFNALFSLPSVFHNSPPLILKSEERSVQRICFLQFLKVICFCQVNRPNCARLFWAIFILWNVTVLFCATISRHVFIPLPVKLFCIHFHWVLLRKSGRNILHSR